MSHNKNEKNNKKIILKAFNTQIIELIEDVKILFPSKTKANALILGFKGFMKISKEHFIECWRDWIICQFNKKIMNKDPTFFEPHVLTEEEKKQFRFEMSLKFVEAIELLKSTIKNSNDKNKEKTLDYVYNLNMLCIHYYDLNQYLV